MDGTKASSVFASSDSVDGRARLRPIRKRPAGLFELGPFDLGQRGLCSTQAKKNPKRDLFDLGQNPPPVPRPLWWAKTM